LNAAVLRASHANKKVRRFVSLQVACGFSLLFFLFCLLLLLPAVV